MKKDLFDENERFIEEANRLEQEVSNAVAPIIKKYKDKGFKLRQIEAVACLSIQALILE